MLCSKEIQILLAEYNLISKFNLSKSVYLVLHIFLCCPLFLFWSLFVVRVSKEKYPELLLGKKPFN